MRRLAFLPLFSFAMLAPANLSAGWPFFAEGPARGTPEYYELHACEPVGERQRIHHGKVWPMVPRPAGEKVPPIHRFHHNLYWPHPYVDMDRESVNEFLRVQIVNGWESATTLYEYHFDPETHELNSAGRRHLYWIMSSVPAEHRAAYVQSSHLDPSISNLRMASVEDEASRLVGNDQVPPVLLRVAMPHGTPASEIDAVFQYRRENLSPVPMIEYGGGGTSGGGG